MNVAKTIIEQLGGGRFAAMTGARNFVALSAAFNGEDGVQFSIGRNAKRVNKVVVTLNGRDLYDVRFWNVTRARCTQVAEYNDVYCDSLRTVFESATGMYTSF
jgi:hypothetical protein